MKRANARRVRAANHNDSFLAQMIEESKQSTVLENIKKRFKFGMIKGLVVDKSVKDADYIEQFQLIMNTIQNQPSPFLKVYQYNVSQFQFANALVGDADKQKSGLIIHNQQILHRWFKGLIIQEIQVRFVDYYCDMTYNDYLQVIADKMQYFSDQTVQLWMRDFHKMIQDMIAVFQAKLRPSPSLHDLRKGIKLSKMDYNDTLEIEQAVLDLRQMDFLIRQLLMLKNKNHMIQYIANHVRPLNLYDETSLEKHQRFVRIDPKSTFLIHQSAIVCYRTSVLNTAPYDEWLADTTTRMDIYQKHYRFLQHSSPNCIETVIQEFLEGVVSRVSAQYGEFLKQIPRKSSLIPHQDPVITVTMPDKSKEDIAVKEDPLYYFVHYRRMFDIQTRVKELMKKGGTLTCLLSIDVDNNIELFTKVITVGYLMNLLNGGPLLPFESIFASSEESFDYDVPSSFLGASQILTDFDLLAKTPKNSLIEQKRREVVQSIRLAIQNTTGIKRYTATIDALMTNSVYPHPATVSLELYQNPDGYMLQDFEFNRGELTKQSIQDEYKEVVKDRGDLDEQFNKLSRWIKSFGNIKKEGQKFMLPFLSLIRTLIQNAEAFQSSQQLIQPQQSDPLVNPLQQSAFDIRSDFMRLKREVTISSLVDFLDTLGWDGYHFRRIEPPTVINQFSKESEFLQRLYCYIKEVDILGAQYVIFVVNDNLQTVNVQQQKLFKQQRLLLVLPQLIVEVIRGGYSSHDTIDYTRRQYATYNKSYNFVYRYYDRGQLTFNCNMPPAIYMRDGAPEFVFSDYVDAEGSGFRARIGPMSLSMIHRCFADQSNHGRNESACEMPLKILPDITQDIGTDYSSDSNVQNVGTAIVGAYLGRDTVYIKPPEQGLQTMHYVFHYPRLESTVQLEPGQIDFSEYDHIYRGFGLQIANDAVTRLNSFNSSVVEIDIGEVLNINQPVVLNDMIKKILMAHQSDLVVKVDSYLSFVAVLQLISLLMTKQNSRDVYELMAGVITKDSYPTKQRDYQRDHGIDVLIAMSQFYTQSTDQWLNKILFVCNGNIQGYRAILRFFAASLMDGSQLFTQTDSSQSMQDMQLSQLKQKVQQQDEAIRRESQGSSADLNLDEAQSISNQSEKEQFKNRILVDVFYKYYSLWMQNTVYRYPVFQTVGLPIKESIDVKYDRNDICHEVQQLINAIRQGAGYKEIMDLQQIVSKVDLVSSNLVFGSILRNDNMLEDLQNLLFQAIERFIQSVERKQQAYDQLSKDMQIILGYIHGFLEYISLKSAVPGLHPPVQEIKEAMVCIFQIRSEITKMMALQMAPDSCLGLIQRTTNQFLADLFESKRVGMQQYLNGRLIYLIMLLSPPVFGKVYQSILKDTIYFKDQSQADDPNVKTKIGFLASFKHFIIPQSHAVEEV